MLFTERLILRKFVESDEDAVIPSAKLRHCHMLPSKAFNQLEKVWFFAIQL